MNEGGPRSKKGQSDAQLENVANEVWKQFENSLSELPSDCRQIYSLYLEGLVPVEISHLLDVSISEVESQITQAKSIVTEDLKTTRKAS
jgi:DNA-directed RNA polymerase specialized sigma24 family protein